MALPDCLWKTQWRPMKVSYSLRWLIPVYGSKSWHDRVLQLSVMHHLVSTCVKMQEFKYMATLKGSTVMQQSHALRRKTNPKVPLQRAKAAKRLFSSWFCEPANGRAHVGNRVAQQQYYYSVSKTQLTCVCFSLQRNLHVIHWSTNASFPHGP